MNYLIRDITTNECPWLEFDLHQGDIVHVYHKHTYGCISPGGVAVTTVKGLEPFFEVPEGALSHDG